MSSLIRLRGITKHYTVGEEQIFRGREMSHMELGRAVLDRLLAEIKEYGASENQYPDVQGNRMTIVIAPNK